MIGDIFASLFMLLIISIPILVFAGWFFWGLISIISVFRIREKPTGIQILLFIVSIFPIAFIVYLVVAFSMGFIHM